MRSRISDPKRAWNIVWMTLAGMSGKTGVRDKILDWYSVFKDRDGKKR